MCTLYGFNTTTQVVDEKYSWINDMIVARQKLVVLYMELASIDENQDVNTETLDKYSSLFTNFREHLIDYLSRGNFKLYPKILELMEKAERRSLSIANKVLPKIEITTSNIMDVMDKFEDNPNISSLKELHECLDEIGKNLNVHFKCEDRLIIGLRLINSIVSLNKK